MFSQFTGKLVPQKEEQITDVVWMNVNELDTSEIDTYNSIRSLLNQIKESAPSLNLNLF
jgi:hypothetical protein